MNWQYHLDFQVRDYELDLLGMVNNGVYQGYLEHCRHEFFKSIGVNFAQFHQEGVRLVVTRAELDYRHILQSGDHFSVYLNFSRQSRVRFLFDQEIRRSDGLLILEAKIIGTALNQAGKPKIPKSLEALFTP